VVLTPPPELPEGALVSALARGWKVTASIAYRPVGFGSHHWEVTDAGGSRGFVTADELETKRHSPHEPQPFGGGWSGPQFVLTHHPPDTPVPGVTFVGDLGRGLAAARAAAGDRYVNVIGASVARQCLESGELDEILVLIAPVLLGDGVRLFDHPGGTNVRLERLSLTHAPNATNLWFRVVG
jgi:hypothetical protein